MRCKQCNDLLTDFEATRKDSHIGEYLDLCNSCFKPISKFMKVRERFDLLRKKDLENLDNDDDDDEDRSRN